MPIKFCLEAYFFRLEGTPSLLSFPEDFCLGFLRPEKIHRPQPDLNPRTLDLEASRLPRDHPGRLANVFNFRPFFRVVFVDYFLGLCICVLC